MPSRSEVEAAIAQIRAQGEEPSVRKVRAITGGRTATVLSLLKEVLPSYQASDDEVLPDGDGLIAEAEDQALRLRAEEHRLGMALAEPMREAREAIAAAQRRLDAARSRLTPATLSALSALEAEYAEGVDALAAAQRELDALLAQRHAANARALEAEARLATLREEATTLRGVLLDSASVPSARLAALQRLRELEGEDGPPSGVNYLAKLGADVAARAGL